MALTPQNQQSPTIEDAFVADRAMFWNRFTGFTKWSTTAIVILLILMWVFLV